MKTGGKKKSVARMSFEQKIRAALPHLAARELWFVEVDYDHSERTMARLGQRASAQHCEKMKKIVAEERKRRFPTSLCPFVHAYSCGWNRRESREMDALYERIQRGVCDTSKLKKIEAGEYIYDGRYYITNVGYDRIHGHRVWSVTDKNDKNCKRIAHGETLRGAVRLLQKILLGGKVVAE